jgi:hypothetical protein
MSNPVIIAIDPGSEYSALLLWDGVNVVEKHLLLNEEIGKIVYTLSLQASEDLIRPYQLVIEQVKLYQTADKNIHDTILWSGRFIESWYRGGASTEPELVARATVKSGLVQSASAKDTQITSYLKDRFGSSTSQKNPHPIIGGLSVKLENGKTKNDLWQALALAVYYWDTYLQERKASGACA